MCKLNKNVFGSDMIVNQRLTKNILSFMTFTQIFCVCSCMKSLLQFEIIMNMI